MARVLEDAGADHGRGRKPVWAMRGQGPPWASPRPGYEAFKDDVVHQSGGPDEFLRVADGPAEEWQLAGFS